MSSYLIERTQRIPAPIEKVWPFFSTARNLQTITPAYMRFEILSDGGSDKIFPGQIITYKLRPVLGVPIFWMTEITHVKQNEYFTDEQRIGPYALWHHSHFFRVIDGGVEMQDKVHYKLPLGVLGNVAHAVFVKKQLEGIFEFRKKVVEDVFGSFR